MLKRKQEKPRNKQKGINYPYTNCGMKNMKQLDLPINFADYCLLTINYMSIIIINSKS